jgi:hypothetical protein
VGSRCRQGKVSANTGTSAVAPREQPIVGAIAAK